MSALNVFSPMSRFSVPIALVTAVCGCVNVETPSVVPAEPKVRVVHSESTRAELNREALAERYRTCRSRQEKLQFCIELKVYKYFLANMWNTPYMWDWGW